MRRSGIAAIGIGIILIISGCTFITVTKLSPKSDTTAVQGQRFSLPRPYIQVTPQTDGSITADIVYLPDPERTYAVKSFSLFASDTLDVSTVNGIVQTINWTGDSSAVVAESIASAGTVASGILQTEKQQKTGQKEKEDAASKVVDDARLELEVAQGTLAFHIANAASPDKILEARLAVQAAALKLSAAQATLARLRGIATADANFQAQEDAASKAVDEAQSKLTQAQGKLEKLRREGAASDAIEQAQGAVKAAKDKLSEAQTTMAEVTGRVFGPKLFAIREEMRESANGKTAYLEVVPAKQQREPPLEQGWNDSQPMYPVKWPNTPKPPDVRIFPEGVNSVRPDQNGNIRLVLQASVPLARLVAEKTRFERDGTDLSPPTMIALDSPTVIDVNLKGFTAGNYTLFLAYQMQKHKDAQHVDGTTPVRIKIVR